MSIVFLYFFNIFIVKFLQLPIFSSMDDKNVENRLQKHDCKENAPAEEFLHCIDIGQLLRELNLDLESLCDWLGLDSQTVNRWSKTKEKNGNRPKFNAIVRMLRNGATTKTLFGIDTSSVQKSSATDELHLSPAVQELLKHPEFVAGIEKAWTDVEAKKNGVYQK